MYYDELEKGYCRTYLDGDPLIVLAVSARSESTSNIKKNTGDWAGGANCASMIIATNHPKDIPIQDKAISKGAGSNSVLHSEQVIFRKGIRESARRGWLGDNPNTGASFAKDFENPQDDDALIKLFKPLLAKLNIELFSERGCCPGCKTFFEKILSDNHRFRYAFPYDQKKNTKELNDELVKIKIEVEQEKPVSTKRNSPPPQPNKIAKTQSISSPGMSSSTISPRRSVIQPTTSSLQERNTDDEDKEDVDEISKSYELLSGETMALDENVAIQQPTSGDGNCAFHAAFGTWDGAQVTCNDYMDIKTRVANATRNSKRGDAIFNSVTVAIQELLHEEKQSAGHILQAYETHMLNDAQEINSCWNALETELNNHKQILDHINDTILGLDAGKQRAINTSQARFNQCLSMDTNDGDPGKILEDFFKGNSVLSQAFEKYKNAPKPFEIDAFIDQDIIDMYAKLIEEDSYWLSPQDLGVVASTLGLNMELYSANNNDMQQIANYSHGSIKQPIKIFYDGVNHFQRICSNAELIVSNDSDIGDTSLGQERIQKNTINLAIPSNIPAQSSDDQNKQATLYVNPVFNNIKDAVILRSPDSNNTLWSLSVPGSDGNMHKIQLPSNIDFSKISYNSQGLLANTAENLAIISSLDQFLTRQPTKLRSKHTIDIAQRAASYLKTYLQQSKQHQNLRPNTTETTSTYQQSPKIGQSNRQIPPTSSLANNKTAVAIALSSNLSIQSTLNSQVPPKSSLDIGRLTRVQSILVKNQESFQQQNQPTMLNAPGTQQKKGQKPFYTDEQCKEFKKNNPGATYKDFKEFNDFKHERHQDISYSDFRRQNPFSDEKKGKITRK